jgi:hypothetical protein
MSGARGKMIGDALAHGTGMAIQHADGVLEHVPIEAVYATPDNPGAAWVRSLVDRNILQDAGGRDPLGLTRGAYWLQGASFRTLAAVLS